jgi:transketolase
VYQHSPDVAVEAASGFGWSQYTGSNAAVLAMQTFGASAPLEQLLQKFGFTAEHIVAAANQQLSRTPALVA